MIIIVYGPQGCGKTRNTEYLCQKLKCEAVFDNEEELIDIKGAITSHTIAISYEGLKRRQYLNPLHGKDVLVFRTEKPEISYKDRRVKQILSFEEAMTL